MAVRAKLTVVAVTDRGAGQPKTVRFEPRYDQAIPEDQRFLKATPWGSLEMAVDNPVALEQLKIGQAFYVDFTPAD